ncbi:hypothetical protein HYV22_03420 [Candidatus Gottesmanbacteria bacterium]|nr:hypothetical protein [Candidatus Gottesmanbacteria bacterium]
MDSKLALKNAKQVVEEARLQLYLADGELAQLIDDPNADGATAMEIATRIAKTMGAGLAASNAIKRWAKDANRSNQPQQNGAILAQAFGKLPPALTPDDPGGSPETAPMHFGEPPQPPGSKPDVVEQLAKAVAGTQLNQPVADQPTQPTNPQVEELLIRGWDAVGQHEVNWAEARQCALRVLEIEPNNQEALKLRDFAVPKVQTTIAPAVNVAEPSSAATADDPEADHWKDRFEHPVHAQGAADQ